MADDNWQEVELGQLIDVKHGFAFKGEFFRKKPPGDILLTPGNFAIGGGFKYDKLKYYDGPVPDEYVLEPGDLLITMTDLSKAADTLGYPALVPDEEVWPRFLHNQRLGLVIIKEPQRLNKRFLYYLMCSREYRHDIVAGATGTTVKHTSPTKIKQFRTVLPPLRQQQSIAETLGSVDDKIELNRRMSRTLEAIARAIFKAWFVDFEPLKAKASGAPGFPGLPQQLFDELPDDFTDSTLGPIPTGWSIRPLGDFVFLDKGLSYKGEFLDASARPMVNLGCFRGHGRFSPNRLKGYSGNYRERHTVMPGDLVLANTDMTQKRIILGSPAIVEDWGGEKPYLFTHHVYAARPTSDSARNWINFIFFCLVQPAFRQRAEGFATGTTVLSLPRDALEHCDFVIPPETIRQEFDSLVTPVRAMQQSCSREAANLARIRDTLRPRLMSGELSVANLPEVNDGD